MVPLNLTCLHCLEHFPLIPLQIILIKTNSIWRNRSNLNFFLVDSNGQTQNKTITLYMSLQSKKVSVSPIYVWLLYQIKGIKNSLYDTDTDNVMRAFVILTRYC